MTIQMTKTQYWSYAIGQGGADWVWANFFDPAHVTRETCEEVDCFHRCYGTAMTANCPICYDTINKEMANLSDPAVQQEILTKCNKCEVPPTADPEVPAEFPAYEEPTVSEPLTFVEYEDRIIELSEEMREE